MKFGGPKKKNKEKHKIKNIKKIHDENSNQL